MSRFKVHFFALILLISGLAYAAPETTNFQASIAKPDGQPLESNNVTFTFRYKNAAGTCTLYVETYTGISMVGSGGNINIQLGSGASVFPGGAPTLIDIFSNNSTNVMPCFEGGTYAPVSTAEKRILDVDFSYPGSNGW